MASIESFLDASEIETAKQLLSTKPPTIHQDLFDAVRDQIFGGVPQIEFLLVGTQSLCTSKMSTDRLPVQLVLCRKRPEA